MKKVFRSALLFAIVLLLLLPVCACSAEPGKKVFTVDGMSITLTTAFVEKPMLAQTACYETEDAMITVLKDRGASFDPEMTLTDYAESVILLNRLNQVNAFVQNDGNLVYFTFEQEVLDKDCSFMAFVYQNGETFWMVQFVCETDDAEEMTPVFFEYARSVAFTA